MSVIVLAIAVSVIAVSLAGGAVAIVAYRRGLMNDEPNIADFCNRLRHISLTIEHQPHAVNYQTVEEWLDDHPEQFEPDDCAKMVATGEVWYVIWHPHTPVGFCHVAASTLERAIQLSLAEAEDQNLTADKPAVVRAAVGDIVRIDPAPIPGMTARWAGRYGRIEWIRYGNVRIDLGDGEQVTCGPGDIALP